MRFVIFVFVLCFASVSQAQFSTVEIDTLETIDVNNVILAQVNVCSLVPISYEMVSEKQKLFGGDRERGRLRKLFERLFGRNKKSMG